MMGVFGEGRKFAAVSPEAELERKGNVIGTAIGGLLEPMGKQARYSKCAALRIQVNSQHVKGRAAGAVTYIGQLPDGTLANFLDQWKPATLTIATRKVGKEALTAMGLVASLLRIYSTA